MSLKHNNPNVKSIRLSITVEAPVETPNQAIMDAILQNGNISGHYQPQDIEYGIRIVKVRAPARRAR